MISLMRICRAASVSASKLSEVYGKNFVVRPGAWMRITEKNREDGTSNDRRYLRLAIESGGCHGFLYKFSFEPATAVDLGEDYLVRADMHEVVEAGRPAAASADVEHEGKAEQPSTSGEVWSRADVRGSDTVEAQKGGGVSSRSTETGTGKETEVVNHPPCMVVDKITVGKMVNAVVDYHRELKGAAFVVVGNELVDQSCACAMSFSLKRKPRAVSGRSSLSDDKARSNRNNSSTGVPARSGGVSVGTPIRRR